MSFDLNMVVISESEQSQNTSKSGNRSLEFLSSGFSEQATVKLPNACKRRRATTFRVRLWNLHAFPKFIDKSVFSFEKATAIGFWQRDTLIRL
jgi:hypothetical protein